MTDWTFKIINTNQRKNSTQTENCRLYQSSLRRVQKERKKKINKEIGGGGGGGGGGGRMIVSLLLNLEW